MFFHFHYLQIFENINDKRWQANILTEKECDCASDPIAGDYCGDVTEEECDSPPDAGDTCPQLK